MIPSPFPRLPQVFKGPWKKDQISKIYTPSSYDKCGYSGTSVNQTNLLIAGEHTCPHRATHPYYPQPLKRPLYFCKLQQHWGKALLLQGLADSSWENANFVPTLGFPVYLELTTSEPWHVLPRGHPDALCSLLGTGYLKLGQLHFTRCHVVYQWARLFIHQRLGLKLFYRKGCGCHVSSVLSICLCFLLVCFWNLDSDPFSFCSQVLVISALWHILVLPLSS